MVFPVVHVADPLLYHELLRQCRRHSNVLLEFGGWGMFTSEPAYRALGCGDGSSLEEQEQGLGHKHMHDLGPPSQSGLWGLFGLMYQRQLQDYIMDSAKQTAKWERRRLLHNADGVAPARSPLGTLFVHADVQYQMVFWDRKSQVTERSALALKHIPGKGESCLLPWGLGHAPYMATELVARGYRPQWGHPVLWVDTSEMAKKFMRGSSLWSALKVDDPVST